MLTFFRAAVFFAAFFAFFLPWAFCACAPDACSALADLAGVAAGLAAALVSVFYVDFSTWTAAFLSAAWAFRPARARPADIRRAMIFFMRAPNRFDGWK